MDIEDLDDDELTHLALLLATAPMDAGPVDRHDAAARRFALARVAVDRDEVTSFPEIGKLPYEHQDRIILARLHQAVTLE
jgi:hypothetical protein